MVSEPLGGVMALLPPPPLDPPMPEGHTHKILVWPIDLTQHLFGINSIQLIIQSGFSKK